MIATAVILYSRFSLSEVSRSRLKKKTVNAFCHCLKAAKFNLKEAMNAYAKILRQSYDPTDGVSHQVVQVHLRAVPAVGSCVSEGYPHKR